LAQRPFTRIDDENLMKLVLMNFCLYNFQIFKEYFNHMFSFSKRLTCFEANYKNDPELKHQVNHSTQVWSQAQEIEKVTRLKQ